MTIFEAIVLGLVQGVADLLPVSSSGHIVLVQRLLGIQDGVLTFTIVVHLATLIPILYVYFDRIKDLIANPFQKMTLFLILGTVPTVIATLLFYDFIEGLFTGDFLAPGFILTGILMLVTDRVKEGKKDTRSMGGKDALFIGLAQAFAIMPGLSRSGTTIFGGVLRSINRKSSVDFSFLLSIPAIAGAVTLQIRQVFLGNVDLGFIFSTPVIVGFFTALISGYLAIRLMLKLVEACKLRYFSYYLFIVSALIIYSEFRG